MKSKRYAIALGVLASITVVVFLVGYDALKQCQHRLEMAFRVTGPQSVERLGPLELKAAGEWAKLHKITVAAVLKDREARALNMGDRTCVVLLLERGAIGPSPVYCFDRSGLTVGRFGEHDE